MILNELNNYFKGFFRGLDLYKVKFQKAEYGTDNNGINKNIVLVEVSGGFNGLYDWSRYLEQISKIICSFSGSYIVDLTVDVPDDLWYLTFGVSVKELEHPFKK